MGLMYTIFILIATVFTGAWAYFRIKEGKVDQDDYERVSEENGSIDEPKE